MSVEREPCIIHPSGSSESELEFFPQRYALGIDDSRALEAAAADLPELFLPRCPERNSWTLSVPLSELQGEILDMVSMGAVVPPGAYKLSPAIHYTYALNIALDRDDRLNREEQHVYDETQLELEYGPNFRLRAHP